MSVRSLSFIAHRPRSFLRAAMGCAFSSQQKSGAMKVNSLPVGYYSASSASVSDMSVPKKRIRGVVFDMVSAVQRCFDGSSFLPTWPQHEKASTL